MNETLGAAMAAKAAAAAFAAGDGVAAPDGLAAPDAAQGGYESPEGAFGAAHDGDLGSAPDAAFGAALDAVQGFHGSFGGAGYGMLAEDIGAAEGGLYTGQAGVAPALLALLGWADTLADCLLQGYICEN